MAAPALEALQKWVAARRALDSSIFEMALRVRATLETGLPAAIAAAATYRPVSGGTAVTPAAGS